MKTVYSFIKYQGNSLVVDFPLNILSAFVECFLFQVQKEHQILLIRIFAEIVL